MTRREAGGGAAFAASRIILTGGGSGIGRCLAVQLAAKGARLALIGRDVQRLAEVCAEIREAGGTALPVVFDLAQAGGHEAVIESARAALGGVDLLVNNAAVSDFTTLAAQQPAQIESIVRTNIAAPILLSRAALPHLLAQRRGHIVNVGSTLGSIGFAHFAAYSASKFALRGFSEALRRELAGSGVEVTYVAPRATRTAINPESLYRLSQKTGMRFDAPQEVAALIVNAIEKGRKDYYIGWPEKFFVRLNGLLPRWVDAALRGQDRAAREYVK